MCAISFEALAQLIDLGVNHWFAAGQHYMSLIQLVGAFRDIVYGQKLSLRFPGCVASVAKPTTQITTAGAHKRARRTTEQAFALNTGEDFTDPNFAPLFGRRF